MANVSTTPGSAPPKTQDENFRADSLAVGLSMMLVIMVVQRGIGFGRRLWFCRVLDDQVLGQWVMSIEFATLVPPMLLLGLPGSLSRYVERYRREGHVRSYVGWVVAGTAGLAAIGFAALLRFPDAFGWWIFRQSAAGDAVVAVAITTLAVILFNTLTNLAQSLRQVRVVSWMQFVQSIAFTGLAITALHWDAGLVALIHVFALATLLGTIPAWRVLLRGWSGLPRSDEPLDHVSMWRRVLPYAMAIWMMNLLSNSFDMADQYMILHFSSTSDLGQSAIGQYQSARIVPSLFVSVVLTGSGVLLPYMAADWEAGRRQAMAEGLKRTLFGVAVVYSVVAALAIALGPWVLKPLLTERYAEGIGVLPLVFAIAIWGALIALSQNYLWVAEKGKWVGVALAAGLLCNFLLNQQLLPRYGLWGGVLATWIANLIVLAVLWAAMAWHGFTIDRTVAWLTLLPATVTVHPLLTVVTVAAIFAIHPPARTMVAEGLRWLVARSARGINAPES